MESNPTMPTQDVTLRTNATMDPLRQEVDFLGKMLGEVIREFEGDASYELSLIHISEPTRQLTQSRFPASA